ncbi:MAG: hypothetical protein H6814_05715 [Phycisphaeraceae bacterium]|nr:hypothetical protein [Phycisphaeraceae bacterium]
MNDTAPSRARRRADRVPGALWIVVGVALIAAGPIALALTLWIDSAASAAITTRFEAPGEVTVVIASPGEYALWQVLGPGEGPTLPEDWRLTMVEAARGREFGVEPQPGPVERTGMTERAEVARVRLTRPGPFTVVVEGTMPPIQYEFGPAVGPGLAGGGLAAPRLLSDAATGVRTLGVLVFGSLSVIGFVVGGSMIVRAIGVRRRARGGDQSQD